MLLRDTMVSFIMFISVKLNIRILQYPFCLLIQWSRLCQQLLITFASFSIASVSTWTGTTLVQFDECCPPVDIIEVGEDICTSHTLEARLVGASCSI